MRTAITDPFTDWRTLRDFIQAGHATITVKSKKTGKHFTYKIEQGQGYIWFVRRKTSWKYDQWIYLGFINGAGFQPSQKTTAEDSVSEEFAVFKWLWNHELNYKHRIHPDMEVYHEGQCGMCGRPLTSPESIARGYGPDCQAIRVKKGYTT